MDPVIELRDLIFSFRVSQALHVAAVLGISDLLADGPKDVALLAEESSSNPDSLRRLMRALAALGVYREEPVDTFASEGLGDALRSDHPQHLADNAINIGRPYFWTAWGDLEHSIRTGENAFAHLNGMDVWTHRLSHPDDGAAFDRAMTANTGLVSESVVTAVDFSSLRSVVDVGGGQGGLLVALLTSAPNTRGVAFDQPQVVDGAREVLEAAGVADRIEVVGGSFFKAVPPGHDGYLLKSVLHDWEDDECRAILRVIRDAMEPHARLFVVEQVLADPNDGLRTKLSDLNMLVMPGGRERTIGEYEVLFAASGLRLVGVTDTSSDFSVIEAATV